MTTPVLLLHGLGSSPSAWDRLRPLLEGAGRIEAPALRCADSIEGEADAVAGGWAGPPRVVVGHSRGGLVATALAERHPHQVARLVLINPPPTVSSRLTARRGSEQLLAVPGLGSLAWQAMTPGVATRGLATAFAPGTAVPEGFVRDLRATGLRSFLAATRAVDDYLAARPLPERVSALRHEIDLVVGQLDQRIDTSAYLGWPGDAPTLLFEVGHTPIWEAPADVAAIVNRAIRAAEVAGEDA